MLLGAGVGIVLAPALGPFSIVLCAGVGLIIGGMNAGWKIRTDDALDPD